MPVLLAKFASRIAHKFVNILVATGIEHVADPFKHVLLPLLMAFCIVLRKTLPQCSKSKDNSLEKLMHCLSFRVSVVSDVEEPKPVTCRKPIGLDGFEGFVQSMLNV